MRGDLPDRFTPKFLEHLDGRTKAAQVLRQRLEDLHADLGGEEVLSYQQKSIARRVIWLECFIETQEIAVAEGAEPDINKIIHSMNTLISLFRLLGIQRQIADVPQLHEYLAKKVKDGDK